MKRFSRISDLSDDGGEWQPFRFDQAVSDRAAKAWAYAVLTVGLIGVAGVCALPWAVVWYCLAK